MATDTITIHTWNFSPYLSHTAAPDPVTTPDAKWNTNMTGVLPIILRNAFLLCNLTDWTDDSTRLPITVEMVPNPRAFERLPLTADLTVLHMLVPFTTDEDGISYLDMHRHQRTGLPAPEFVPLVDCPGSVHFYKQEEEAAGSDLVTVIFQGWPMLVLILLGAGYSGIIIWLLDRLWNPSNFPKPFIRGFWEGFWWAFVTMTTVGYGDTTPRSFQARIFGLVWIMVGITILSVFTATVTTVLTQESLEQHYSIFGNAVGVIDGTEDYRLVIKHGGRPTVAQNFAEILENAYDKSIHSATYDQFAFSSRQELLAGQFLVERIVDNPVRHGVLLVGPHGEVKSCLAHHLRAQQAQAFREMIKQITPYTTITTSAADNAQNLFQPTTITYMWYGLAIWIAIFVGFVMWEFIYWRPKHKRRKEMKRQINLERGINPQDSNSNSESESCFPKRPSTYSKKQIQAFKRSSAGQKVDPLGPRPVDKLTSTDDKTQQQQQPKSLGIQALQRGAGPPGSRSPRFNNQKKELIEVGDLEALIRRQTAEVESLDDELAGYKSQWALRLKDLKRQHREERRKLLRLMDHDNSIWNETRAATTGGGDSGGGDTAAKVQADSVHSPLSPLHTVAKKTKFTNYNNNILAPDDNSGNALPFDDTVSSI